MVIFSAHGVSPAVREAATTRRLRVIDATCPLVTKVHLEAIRYAKEGRTIVLVGHADHDEVIGTLGEAPRRSVVIDSVEEAEQLVVEDPEKVAYLTQTTLSVDDTKAVIEVLRRRFPRILGPARDDICYATQNRQAAVKQLANDVDLALGTRARLINDVRDIRGEWLHGCSRVGVTAGASTPEFLVREVVDYLGARGGPAVREFRVVEEDVRFGLPHELLEIARQKQAASAAAS